MRINQIIETIITEGPHDPSIFKAIFLAGGGGSGKGMIARQTTQGMGFKTVNSDDVFEYLMRKNNLSLRMPPEETEKRDAVRKQAQDITANRLGNYIEGRLGLIIDSTAADITKSTQIKDRLEALGYETKMIFVNTDLQVALDRNDQRNRRVPVDIVTYAWTSTQKNKATFQTLFGNEDFYSVNNSSLMTPERSQELTDTMWKPIKQWTETPVHNPVATKWLASI